MISADSVVRKGRIVEPQKFDNHKIIEKYKMNNKLLADSTYYRATTTSQLHKINPQADP